MTTRVIVSRSWEVCSRELATMSLQLRWGARPASAFWPAPRSPTPVLPVDGDLGVSPGSAVTGFFTVDGGPGTVSGAIHSGDVTAATAQSSLTTAFNNAAGRPPGTSVSGNLGGRTLAPGIFTATSSLEISSGDLTLTAVGDEDAVFIFQIPSSLTVTSGRRVILTGGAQAANVFWQVGSSATLGTNSDSVERSWPRHRSRCRPAHPCRAGRWHAPGRCPRVERCFPVTPRGT